MILKIFLGIILVCINILYIAGAALCFVLLYSEIKDSMKSK